MSYQATEYVSKHSTARGSARAVLFWLAHQADADGRSWPLQETIARHVNLSVRQVQRHLDWLEAAGEIAILHSRGRGNRAIYRVLLPAGAEKGDTADVFHAPKGDIRGAQNTTSAPEKGDTSRAEKATSTARKHDISGRAYKDDRTTDRTADRPTGSSSSTGRARVDDDDQPNTARAPAAGVGNSNGNSSGNGAPRPGARASPAACRSVGALTAAYSDTDLRAAAWEIGAGLGLIAEWGGFEAWLRAQPGQTLARLLLWMQHYADLPLERLDRIESLTGVLRAHLARGELAAITTQQGEYLARQIQRALTARQLAAAKGYIGEDRPRTGVLQ